MLVNPALERINGVSADRHLGKRIAEILPFLDASAIEARMREVMVTGVPVLDEFTTGRIAADHDGERAWLVSLYRLDDQAHRVIGVAVSVMDVTEQHRTAVSAAHARRRLS